MAIPRRTPYLHVSWLAKAMAGQLSCLWSVWFQSHYQFARQPAASVDLVSWQIAHTRLLTTLAEQLVARGDTPRLEVPIQLVDRDSGATISGRIDCLVLTATRVTVYDCKVGQPDSTHALQVMLYLHALRQDARLDARTFEGILVYPDTQLSVAAPPPAFAADVAYFARLLAGPTPALKVPGPNCRFCPIGRSDCPERLEAVGEGVPPSLG